MRIDMARIDSELNMDRFYCLQTAFLGDVCFNRFMQIETDDLFDGINH